MPSGQVRLAMVTDPDVGAPDLDDPLPTPENLPPPPEVPSTSAKAQEFNDAANRATSRVNIDDYDDAAILLSLREQLREDPELEALNPTWAVPLDEAIARAEALRRLRVVRTTLQQAFADATLNPETSVYDGIDMVSCRRAFAALSERFAGDAELEVSIDPVGKKRLSAFHELCEFSHQASLATITFPRNIGRKRLRRFARRQFKATFPEVKLRKISVTEKKWIKNDAGDRRELRFTVGIERKNAFPRDPCVMQELSVFQDKIGRRFRATECCDVREETPILCDLLE